MQPQLAHDGRICAYDRAGLGWSEAGPGGYAPGDAADDLYRLLIAADEPGPYILVGQSLGARAALLFAQRRPELVAGVVLVDPRSEYIDDRQTPEDIAAERAQVVEFQEQLAIATRFGLNRLLWSSLWPHALPVAANLAPAVRAEIGILQATAKHRTAALAEIEQMRLHNDELRAVALGDLPLIVVAAGTTPESFPDWPAAQSYEAARSTNSRLITAPGSHHMVHWDQPDIVTEAVRTIIAAAMSGKPLAW